MRYFVLRFLLGKPSDLFAVLVILLTWVFHDELFAISTPTYLALATASRVSPCSVYVVGSGERDLVVQKEKKCAFLITSQVK